MKNQFNPAIKQIGCGCSVCRHMFGDAAFEIAQAVNANSEQIGGRSSKVVRSSG
jgi:hypothetical protein